MTGETMYTDMNNKVICTNDELEDEEHFIWKVEEKDGNYVITCDDLLAEEPVYPRAKYCKVINR